MKHIERWNLMRSSAKESLSEHTCEVAMLAAALCNINNAVFDGKADAGKASLIALYHDASEVFTGDMPTPSKYFNEKMRSVYSELEKSADEKLLGMLPKELKPAYQEIFFADKNSIEAKFVKAADKLSAYIKCLEERSSGNSEFKDAEKSLKEIINAIDLPEIKYFINEFLGAYGKTLDELK